MQQNYLDRSVFILSHRLSAIKRKLCHGHSCWRLRMSTFMPSWPNLWRLLPIKLRCFTYLYNRYKFKWVLRFSKMIRWGWAFKRRGPCDWRQSLQLACFTTCSSFGLGAPTMGDLINNLSSSGLLPNTIDMGLSRLSICLTNLNSRDLSLSCAASQVIHT